MIDNINAGVQPYMYEPESVTDEGETLAEATILRMLVVYQPYAVGVWRDLATKCDIKMWRDFLSR